jgi:hypothetical protein
LANGTKQDVSKPPENAITAVLKVIVYYVLLFIKMQNYSK